MNRLNYKYMHLVCIRNTQAMLLLSAAYVPNDTHSLYLNLSLLLP